MTDIENEGVKLTPVAVGKFAKYITDRGKTVLWKLIRNVRRMNAWIYEFIFIVQFVNLYKINLYRCKIKNRRKKKGSCED